MISIPGDQPRVSRDPIEAELVIDPVEVDFANTHVKSDLECNHHDTPARRDVVMNVRAALERGSLLETNPGEIRVEVPGHVGGSDDQLPPTPFGNLVPEVLKHMRICDYGVVGPEGDARVGEMEAITAEGDFVLQAFEVLQPHAGPISDHEGAAALVAALVGVDLLAVP
jgi:hypothetical protein